MLRDANSNGTNTRRPSYFLGRVFTDTILPEFDSTTLGLLGLSASAYLGLKVPVKHS
jgi:hypothetical protein